MRVIACTNPGAGDRLAAGARPLAVIAPKCSPWYELRSASTSKFRVNRATSTARSTASAPLLTGCTTQSWPAGNVATSSSANWAGPGW